MPGLWRGGKPTTWKVLWQLRAKVDMSDEKNRQSEIKKSLRTRMPRNKPHSVERPSFVDALKNEWQLFWAGLKSSEDEFDRAELQPLDLPKIKALTKTLSDERKKLNRRLETIQKEIELNTAKLESLKLVGASPEETVERISELTDLGQLVVDQLSKVDNRLDWARRQQSAISSR